MHNFFIYCCWRPFWKIAAMGAMMKIHDASISNSFYNTFGYMCTKFHAFATKCTIPLYIVVGGHFEKLLPWAPWWKFMMPPYPILFITHLAICVPNFMLLPQNAQFLYILLRAAILKNCCHGRHDGNLWCLHIQIFLGWLWLYVYQISRFYHKMHNHFGCLLHYCSWGLDISPLFSIFVCWYFEYFWYLVTYSISLTAF